MMTISCEECGENVVLEGDNVGKDTIYEGFCSNCGHLNTIRNDGKTGKRIK